MSSVHERSRQVLGRTPVSERKSTVRATARIEKDFHMRGRVGRFSLESDEPEERGGTDLAPTPLQYFLAATAF